VKIQDGPFVIGLDLAGYSKDRSYAVVLSGTKEHATLFECAKTLPAESLCNTLIWVQSLTERYPNCLLAAWRDPVSGPALDRIRFGISGGMRVRLYTPTRDERERLAWQVRMMCEYGRINLANLPVSHQIANAIAIDSLPVGKAPYVVVPE